VSKKDIEKGIEIQAKADAAHEEQLAKGLKAHSEMLKEIAAGQEQTSDLVGVVLQDMAGLDSQVKFGLGSTKKIIDMDLTERRVLCFCVYTLMSRLDQVSDAQREFYCCLEDCLGVSERQDGFDFASLSNVDSHADRLCMASAICAFLFLGDFSFDFLKDKESYGWLFDFVSKREINNACGEIEAQFRMLGAPGILGNYRLQAPAEEVLETADEAIEIELLLDEIDSEKADSGYSLLTAIIEKQLCDSNGFGKRVENYNDIVKRELARSQPRVSYDAVIATTKLGNGYLFFTTYALYVKTGSWLSGSYECLPYKSIDASGIAFSEGKSAESRKLFVPYYDEDGNKQSVTIDDDVLVEENLRDLIKDIAESSCEIAPTDKRVRIGELGKDAKKILLSILSYVTKLNQASLSEAYAAAVYLGVESAWNESVDAIETADDFRAAVKSFKALIPYPSENSVCKAMLYLLLQCVACANRATGKETTMLTDDADRTLRELDVKGLSNEEFNKLISGFKNSKPLTNVEDYGVILGGLSPKIRYNDEIRGGIEASIQFLEDDSENQVLKTIQSVADDVTTGVGKFVSSIFGSGKSGAKLALPKEYKQMKQKLPAEAGVPKEALVYDAAAEGFSALVVCFPVSDEESMPFDNNQGIIDDLHESMDDGWGLIEVNSGKCKAGGQYVYSIRKYAKPSEDGFPAGNGYALNINLQIKDVIQFIQASFEEEGMTGMRDSLVFAMFQQAHAEEDSSADDDAFAGWSFDPYDPSFTKGFLMNVSEKADFDEQFPDHPLSQARRFVKYVVENN